MGGEVGIAAPFAGLAEQIRFGSEHGVAESWDQMTNRPEFKCLQPGDKEAIRELGVFLGSTDRIDQMLKITQCQEKLKLGLIRAEDDCVKRIGLYRYLGFAAGAVAVLLLV
jgi:stage III sporulation protein AB